MISGFIIFALLTRKYKNIYKLFFVFGKKGSGKSTFLVKQALKYKKKGFTIYTNMADMCIPDARLINLDDLGDFVPESDSCCLFDEVGMQWDARDFKKFKPSVRDFFKLQRHYHVVVFLASQTFDIDKKLRDLCDHMYLITNFLTVFSLVRPVRKKIVITEASSDNESRISENLKIASIFDWRFVYIPKYARYFDSFVVPDMPKLPFTLLGLPAPNESDYVPLHLAFYNQTSVEDKGYYPKHTHGYVTLNRLGVLVTDWFYNFLECNILTRFIDVSLTWFASHCDVPDDDFDVKTIIIEFMIYFTLFLFCIFALFFVLLWVF